MDVVGSFRRRAQGLPQNTVEGLAVDARGYLWAGTQDGVAVHDGRRWKEVALCLLADREEGEETLWIGTDDSAARLDLSGPEPRWLVLGEGSHPALSNHVVYAVEADARGRIYLVTNRNVKVNSFLARART